MIHSSVTQSMSIIQWLKKNKRKTLKSTDCYLLLMFVFLGIFSRHFVNRFIYMEIYIFIIYIYICNFSLCKEVKDNHLNVALCNNRSDAESLVHTRAVKQHLAFPSKTSSSKHTYTQNVNQHPGSIRGEHWRISSLSWTTKTWQHFLGWNKNGFFLFSPTQFIQK